MDGDTRRDARVKIELAVRVKCEDWMEFAILDAEDISRSGIFLRTNKSAAQGAFVEMVIVGDRDTALPCDGTVARTVDADEARERGVPQGLGISFGHAPPELLAEIDELVGIAARLEELPPLQPPPLDGGVVVRERSYREAGEGRGKVDAGIFEEAEDAYESTGGWQPRVTLNPEDELLAEWKRLFGDEEPPDPYEEPQALDDEDLEDLPTEALLPTVDEAAHHSVPSTTVPVDSVPFAAAPAVDPREEPSSHEPPEGAEPSRVELSMEAIDAAVHRVFARQNALRVKRNELASMPEAPDVPAAPTGGVEVLGDQAGEKELESFYQVVKQRLEDAPHEVFVVSAMALERFPASERFLLLLHLSAGVLHENKGNIEDAYLHFEEAARVDTNSMMAVRYLRAISQKRAPREAKPKKRWTLFGRKK